MKERIMKTLIVSVLLVLVMSGCKDTSSADKKTKEETATAKVEKIIDDEVKNSDSADKHPSTPDSSTSPDVSEPAEQTTTDSTKETDSNKTSTKQKTTISNTAVAPSNNQTQQHTHTWIEVTQTITHPEEGHWDYSIDEEWYKEHYASRTFCNRCKDPETGKPLDITGNAIIHVVTVCGGGYYADRVQIKPGEPVTKEEWVIDKAAWTETIVTGYKCECGATK